MPAIEGQASTETNPTVATARAEHPFKLLAPRHSSTRGLIQNSLPAPPKLGFIPGHQAPKSHF
jgi:hypothetical protein